MCWNQRKTLNYKPRCLHHDVVHKFQAFPGIGKLGICQNPAPNLADFNRKGISFLRKYLDDSSRALDIPSFQALKTLSENSQNVSLEKPRLSLSFCLVCLQFSLDILNWRSMETSYKTLWGKHQQTDPPHTTHDLFSPFLFGGGSSSCSRNIRALSASEFELTRPAGSFPPPPFQLPSFRNTREWGHASHLMLHWNPVS